jgi:hypothetical protein
MLSTFPVLISIAIFIFVYLKVSDMQFERRAEQSSKNTAAGDGDGKSCSVVVPKAEVLHRRRDVVKRGFGKVKVGGKRVLKKLASAASRLSGKFGYRRGKRLTYAVLGVTGSGGVSSHLEQPLSQLDLTAEQYARVQEQYTDPILHVPGMHARAREVNFPLSEHLAYRYFCSCGWADEFYGKSIAEAMVDSVEWREEFGLDRIDTEPLVPLVEKGLIYLKGMDESNRPILYFKFQNNNKDLGIDTDLYLDMLMYNVEKANAESQEPHVASGEFIGIVDLKGITFDTLPPLSTFKLAIGLLKRHYPYRLRTLYALNGGIVFTTFWKLLKPLVPLRAQQKIKILSVAEFATVLLPEIGAENLEEEYGGELKGGVEDIDTYFD